MGWVASLILLLLLVLAVLVFGVGFVLKLVGLAVGFVFALALGGVVLFAALIAWITHRSA